MELNYPQQPNGMYVLNGNDLEHIATGVLSEYFPHNLDYPLPLNTDALFDDLGLLVKHKFLGVPEHEILGATVMGDTADIPAFDLMKGVILLEETYGTVLINSELCCASKAPRRRYTEVHECSHWLLHRPYYKKLSQSDKSCFVACRTVETYKQKTRTDADWREWQADRLAAAMLMPRDVFYDYAKAELKKAGASRGYLVEGQSRDRQIFDEAIVPITRRFSVSKRAAQIRMIRLNLIQTQSRD